MELSIPGAHQVIVHGLADEVVPVAISRDYAQTKQKRGEQVELLAIAKATHFDLMDPRSKPFATVAEALLRLARIEG